MTLRAYHTPRPMSSERVERAADEIIATITDAAENFEISGAEPGGIDEIAVKVAAWTGRFVEVSGSTIYVAAKQTEIAL